MGDSRDVILSLRIFFEDRYLNRRYIFKQDRSAALAEWRQVERVIGSLRRELLDPNIILSESHPRRLVSSYLVTILGELTNHWTETPRIAGQRARPIPTKSWSGPPRTGSSINIFRILYEFSGRTILALPMRITPFSPIEYLCKTA